jgi:hypothetical protein
MSKSQEREEAINRLKELLKPGDTVYTVLRHVSRSGMSRAIDVYKITSGKDGRPEKSWLSYNVAKALEWGFNKNYEAVSVGGCGMDMGFHLVYTLSRVLFKEYTCLGKDCPANDHSNGMPRPARPSKRVKHGDGGYALNQEWI